MSIQLTRTAAKRISKASIVTRASSRRYYPAALHNASPLRNDWLAARSGCVVGITPQRGFHWSPISRHGGIDRLAPGTGIKLNFKDSKGNLLKTVEGNEGDSILDVAHEYDIDLEGACEASIACSTCHIILPLSHYNALPEPSDDENDMLDMAFGLTDTSRLGCQVHLTKGMEGMDVQLPSATRNMYVDGKKPVH